MRKAVVTGAGGFVGSAVVRELTARGVFVLALGRRDIAGMFENNPLVQTIVLDMAEIDRLAQLIGERDYDVLYHFAWAGIAGAQREDSAVQLQNVQWTVDAVRAAKALGCARFVGAGSIMEKEILALVDQQASQPQMGHIYSAAKLSAHCMSKCAAAGLGVGHIWGIITNAYGPGEIAPRLVQTTLRRIAAGEPLQFTSGGQAYDFVYITDIARAFFMLGEMGKPFTQYVIGSGNARPLREFLIQIQTILAPDRALELGVIPFSGVSLQYADYDISSLFADTGFVPQVPFEEGIRKTMAWIQQGQGGR